MGKAVTANLLLMEVKVFLFKLAKKKLFVKLKFRCAKRPKSLEFLLRLYHFLKKKQALVIRQLMEDEKPPKILKAKDGILKTLSAMF